MANRRYIDFPIASTSGDTDIILIWQDGANKQTTKATFLSNLPENLDELNDVVISGLTNGQILRYDSVTGKWENTDQGNLDLNDLNDVSIVSPSNGQVLVYNSSTSKWENSSAGFVPYTGAVTTVNLGAQQLIAGQTTLTTNGSSDTLTVNHTSGSGKAINVIKGGNGEGLYINKTSGSGNAATIVGTLEATTLVKTGGTSSQFLKADGSVDSTSYGTGTVTSVGLSSATSGVTIGSTPVTTSGTITLAIATASGSQNGLLSSTDWTTFNNKQNALTNPVTGTGTTNYLPKFTGSTTIGNSQVFDDGTNVGIGTGTPTSFGAGYTVTSINGSSGGGVLDLMVNNTRVLTLAVDGSLPSISSRVSGFPIVFRTNNGGTVDERFRIFSDGNVLIQSGGTFTNNGAKLQVSGTATTMATITSSGTASGLQLTNTGSTASSWIIQSDGGAVAGQAALRFYSLTASAYRMSIDGSGNVGIGTSSPSALLEVRKDGIDNHIGISGSITSNIGYFSFVSNNSPNRLLAVGGIDGIQFKTGDYNAATERMRITSGGNVLIGTTTDVARVSVDYSDSNNNGISINETSGVGSTFLMLFRSQNINKGSIQINAGNTGVNFNTTSDYRLKEDLKNYNGFEIINKIKTYDYKWKNTNFRSYGVLAHELQEIIPDVISGKKDEIDNKGNEIMQGVDYSKLVPIMVKAIQELKQEIDTLKN